MRPFYQAFVLVRFSKLRLVYIFFVKVLVFLIVKMFFHMTQLIQAEECALRSNVDRFNTRRYANLLGSGGGGAGPGSITENCGSAAPSDSALTVINWAVISRLTSKNRFVRTVEI